MKSSKPILSAAVAVGTMLGIGAASAADLAVKAMPYAAPVPVFSWTGCYIGVHAGAGAMRDSVGSHGSQMNIGTDYTGTGGLAGGQVGCNYQDGNWVFGAEGEGYWSGMKTTDASSSAIVNGEGFRDTDTAKNKYDFSIAARAGIAFDRTLVYGKAGWVWGKFDFLSSDTNFTGVGIPPVIRSSSASGTLDGLLLGVGIEHALTNNWTVKLEYNFLKYGSKELSFTSCDNTRTPTCFADGTGTVRADKQIFKIGANYLFNMAPAAVVARY
jgi:outer membrane immunogenic protein